MHTQNLSLPPRPPHRYWQDSEWARQNIQTLTEKYPDEWVAVFGQQVIAHHADLDQVMSATQAKGLASLVIKFIESGIRVYAHQERFSNKTSCLNIPVIKSVKFIDDPRLRREEIY
ncbi:hypothetical protein HUU05_12510 [candidate division KSB1 bacterium]|nr:hypothetical protein [candidate division KSB1 bacterium]